MYTWENRWPAGGWLLPTIVFALLGAAFLLPRTLPLNPTVLLLSAGPCLTLIYLVGLRGLELRARHAVAIEPVSVTGPNCRRGLSRKEVPCRLNHSAIKCR